MTAKIGRVIVGVDGSENARLALQWAILLGERFGAEVVAVHAVGLLAHPHGDADPVPAHSHLAEVREEFESEWCEALTSSDLEYRCLLLEGPAAEMLLDVADQEEADVVVVGSRGVGGFAERLLGSTSIWVVEHTSRTVVVVPGTPSDV